MKRVQRNEAPREAHFNDAVARTETEVIGQTAREGVLQVQDDNVLKLLRGLCEESVKDAGSTRRAGDIDSNRERMLQGTLEIAGLVVAWLLHR